MAKVRTIRCALLVIGMSVCAAAQNNPPSEPGTTPAPAFGQNAPVLNPDNPPVSGLDEPALELHRANRSFVSPALAVSESADTNGGNALGSTGLTSITHVLGALDLQQFWPRTDLFLEYVGGGAFYSTPYNVKQLHAVGMEGVTRWRTGQLTVRDAFNYLPDGSFSMGIGSNPGFGLAIGGGGMAGQGGVLPGSLQWGNGQFGSVGNIPRIANTAIIDVVEAISPVSAFTVAGGFSNAHFYDPTDTLIDSDQLTLEGGYSHLLGRHDQIGAIYAFQLLQFPQYTGGQIYDNIVNVRWSHTLSGRMSLIAGAGPQYTYLEEGGYYTRWSLSARVRLEYRLGHGAITASYEKFTSAGSGLFLGAKVQSALLGYSRPLGRTWNVVATAGYSHNTKIEVGLAPGGGSLGANALSYNGGSASAVLRKHLGRTYDFLASYRFSETAFDVPVSVGGVTGRIGQRQTGAIGLEWHPTPTRIE
jgi:hypothetical protein